MIRIVKSEAESTICNLEIENTVLDTWYSASCSNEMYVARLNAIIPGQALVVKQCNSCETRIKVKACKVYHKSLLSCLSYYAYAASSAYIINLI